MTIEFNHKSEKDYLRGKRARANGDFFEKVCETILDMEGFKSEKIPSGARWVSQTKVVPVKTPFDFISARGGKCLLFDCKSTDGKTFTYTMIKSKFHQVESLLGFQKVGIRAGYCKCLQTRLRICRCKTQWKTLWTN